ncbi:MAG: hypothetical protein AAFQ35_12650, partial [Pseudomonadota bacterium]
LRNTLLANFLDWPAISQPMTPHGSAPAGLMLFGQYGDDETVFSIAAAVEQALAPTVSGGPVG